MKRRLNSSSPSIKREPLSKIYQRALAPSADSLARVRLLASNKNLRPNQLREVLLDDPVLTLELLYAANRLSGSGLAPLSSLEQSIIRLGEEGIQSFLSVMNRQSTSFSLKGEARWWYDALLLRGTMIGKVSRFIAEAMPAESVLLVHTAAILAAVGDLLALIHLGHQFILMANEVKFVQSKIDYRLHNDFGFSPQIVVNRYLSQRGILPVINVFVEGRELTPEEKLRSEARRIIASARELVVAYERGEWERYHPERNLPARSEIRLLRFKSHTGYASAYGRADQYFRLLEREFEEAETEDS